MNTKKELKKNLERFNNRDGAPPVVPKEAVRNVRRVHFEFEVTSKAGGVLLDAITLMLRTISLNEILTGIRYISTFERYDYGDGFEDISRTLEKN